MPCALSTARSYWSVPALIDWISLSFFALGASSFFQRPDTESTSALPIFASISAALRAISKRMPVLRAVKGSANS